MADLAGFDANQHEPNGFDVLPAGTYSAVIVSSELKSTRDNQGRYLKLELQITDGQFQNRKLFDQLNLYSHGPKKDVTEKIAKGTLSAICRAVGVLTPKDSQDLHFKKLKVKVAIEKSDQYGEQNRIKAYLPATASSAPTTSIAPPGAGGKSPWGTP
jgi:hypothetical protein